MLKENQQQDGIDLNQIIKFQIRRHITNIFKNSLFIIEELQTDFPYPDYIYEEYRKEILRKSNNSIRELEELIENTEINFKKKE